MRLAIEPFRHRKVNRLIKAAEPETPGTGTFVYRAGDPADAAILVGSGYLSLHAPPDAPSPDGPEEPGPAVAVTLPGEVAGLGALQRGETERSWTAVAGPGLELRRLPSRRLRRAVRTSETTLDSLLAGSLAADRLRSDLLAGRPTAAARLGHVLADLAARGDGEGARVPHRIPHRILADLAGIHRSTATTLLNDWIYRGLLEPLDPGWRLAEGMTLPGT